MDKWSEGQFTKLLEEVQEPFQDGFDWEDIPKALKTSLDVVQGLDELTNTEKRDGAIKLGRGLLEKHLPVLLDEHDLPWVPAMLEKTVVDPWLLKGALWAYDRFAPDLFTWVVDAAKGRLAIKQG